MLKAFWNRFWCVTAEWHCPVHVWADDEVVPVAVKCSVCGHRLHRDEDGHWYCHESQWSSAVIEIVVVLLAIMFFSSVVFMHFGIFKALP